MSNARKNLAYESLDAPCDARDSPAMANCTIPPLQKGMPFKRKDIAKAFFDLDVSDSEPLTVS